MKLNQTSLDGNIGNEADKPDLSYSLRKLVKADISGVEDVYNNLSTEYDPSVCEKFEKHFIGMRNTYKGKLRDMSDEHHDLINRSEMKKNAVEKILKSTTDVAERFQESRENKRLNRPSVTNSLEDLKYDLKNFDHLLEKQGK